jgi:hypothetical protein
MEIEQLKNKVNHYLPWIVIGIVTIFLGVSIFFVIKFNNEKRELLIQKEELTRNKESLEKENKDFKDENFNLKNEIESIKRSALPSIDVLEEARKKAQIASIKSSMASINPIGILCRDNNGKILSGNSGSSACSNDPSLKWPNMGLCGETAGDSKFTVFNGEKDDWDITISCKNITVCNGPENAICNSNGCDFKETCK